MPCTMAEQREYRQRGPRPPPPEPMHFPRVLQGSRFIITAAQNATPVHPEFLAALQVAAQEMGADLVVIPLRYKNPTSVWSTRQETDEWWDPALTPHLFDGRKKIGPNLVLVGDIKIQPTALSPLTGFEALTGGESCIIGHPKMQLRTVPAPSGKTPKILSTTGAVTKRNYTDSKAGALGAFHHHLGAVVVELKGKRFHLRQITADRTTGEFTDLDRVYSPAGVRKAPPALGLVLGDTHARWTSPEVDRATFGRRGIVPTLDPRVLVFNDLFDGWSVNPHHEGDPFIAIAKARVSGGNVLEEIKHAVRYVAKRSAGRQAVVVPSNHDDFLARWVRSTDWRRTPGNAAFYLETAAALVARTTVDGGGARYPDPFAFWVDRLKGKARIRCLAPDEVFRLGTIECGLHGDRGPNGAKGTLKNLSRLGARIISGHTHTPGIEEGHYQVGTSTPLRMEYTRGPSSWLQAHCVVYADGARSLLVIIDGEWRA